MGLLGYLEQTAFCGSGNPAVGGLCFHKHDIGADFFDAVKNGKFNIDFVDEIPAEKLHYRLEGYLFPDTYIFYENDDPQRVLSRMLYNKLSTYNQR